MMNMLIDHMKADLRQHEDNLLRVRLLKSIETDPTKVGIYTGEEVSLLDTITNLKVYIAMLLGEINTHVINHKMEIRIGQVKETAPA
jgi:uncharacterized iron-regulated protein